MESKNEGKHYNISKKVNRNTLLFLTYMITNLEIDKTDDNFMKEYQRVKRINKLMRAAYPFIDFKDLAKNKNRLYMAIETIYKNENIKQILKNKCNNKELKLFEIEEYYKFIEVCFGCEYLKENKEYKKYKKTFKVIDEFREIQQMFDIDMNRLLNIVDQYNDKDVVMKVMDEYMDIQSSAFYNVRKKFSMLEKSINKDRENECKNVSMVECKYYEAKDVLDKMIIKGERKVICIDCMGKKYSEVFSILNELYEDEYIITNFVL